MRKATTQKKGEEAKREKGEKGYPMKRGYASLKGLVMLAPSPLLFVVAGFTDGFKTALLHTNREEGTMKVRYVLQIPVHSAPPPLAKGREARADLFLPYSG